MPIDFSAIARGAQDKLNDPSIKPYLLPAAAGAAGGGALMAMMAAKHREGEQPSVRRHRILRNALLGLTLGGVAGGAIPAGANKLMEQAAPMHGFHPIDAAANGTIKHWAPAATGLGAGTLAWHHLGKNREQAALHLADTLHPAAASDRYMGRNTMESAMMTEAASPKGQPDMIRQIAAKLQGGKPEAGMASNWRAREMLGEAGVTPASIASITDPEDKAKTISGLTDHLASEGPISRLMGKSVPALGSLREKMMAPGTGFPAEARQWLAKNVLPENHALAEGYSRLVRPSVGRYLNAGETRLGVVPMALGVGGSMLAANYAQQKLQGN